MGGLMLFCSPAGRVLHVDNRSTVPYTAVNDKLKQRVIHALVKHRQITAEQEFSCQVNIMQMGSLYLVEVWPDGESSGCRFGVRLKRVMLIPAGRYFDCRDTTAGGAAPGTSSDSLVK